MATYKLAGQVKNRKTGQGFPDLVVEAWDKDVKSSDLLGTATTGAQGHFAVEFDDAAFSDKGTDPKPYIFVKIFSGKQLLHSTEKSPIEDWTPQHPFLVIEVNPPTQPDDETRFVVEGEVVEPDGKPLPNHLVRAFDRAVGAWRPLGEARTGDGGRYLVSYDPEEKLKPWGKTRADLKVEVYDEAAAGDKVLAASPLIMQALPKETIDFSISQEGKPYHGPDEYSLVHQALKTLLDPVSDLNSLEVVDVLILARETQQISSNVAYYIKALRWSQELGLPAPVFYGLLRRSESVQLDRLLAQPLSELWKSLQQARKENVVQLELNDTLQTRLSDAQQSYLSHEDHPYSKLLNTTSLGKSQQATFTRLLTSGTYSGKEFWEKLETEAGFTDSQITDLWETFQLQSLTDNTSLAIHLRSEKIGVHKPEETASFSVERWTEIVSAEAVEIPEDVLPGEDDAVREKAYAQALYRQSETRYPTRSLAGQMSRSASWQHPQLTKFLTDNGDFDFTSHRVTYFLNEHPQAIDEAGKEDLLRLEQLFHVTPSEDKLRAIEPLWNAGVRSAPQIAAGGRHQLMRQLNGTVPGTVVSQIYHDAVHVTSVALQVYLRYHPALNRLSLYALHPPKLQKDKPVALPEWEALFGSVDSCACTHCESASSPAAYLVDTMAFLQRAHDGTGKNGLDYFFDRRPDLGTLRLDCKNTEMLLPQIDLAVETMEQIVANSTDGKTIPATGFGQTTWDSELLAAQPENMEPKAYNTLREAVYPFDQLPFDLWLEEGRRYLEQMGISRHELMRVMPAKPGVNTLAIATETLGMSRKEREIIVNPDPRRATLKHHWGLDDSPISLEKLGSSIALLLKQARIDYETLSRLLNTRYLNPDQGISVSFGDTPCSLDDAKLVGKKDIPLAEPELFAFLDRLHRFLRLQHRLDWTEYDLDMVIQALGINDFTDQDFLPKLGAISELHNASNLSISELCTWWGMIDTYIFEDSLLSQYEAIFLNPLLFPDTYTGAGPDLRNDIFALNAARTELLAATSADPWLATKPTYTLQPDYAAYLQAVTGLTSEDLFLLVSEVLPKDAATGHVRLNLANLSLLYRLASFTGALQVSVSEYLQLTAVTGLETLPSSSSAIGPVESKAAWDLFREIDAGNPSIEALAYLLLHDTDAAAGLAPKPEDLDALLEQLSQGYEGILDPDSVNAELKTALTQSLSGSLGLDGTLLHDVLFTHRPTLGKELLDNLILAANPQHSLPSPPADDFHAIYETLHKFGLAWKALGLDHSHLAFVANEGPTRLGWIDTLSLPIEPTTSTSFSKWQRLSQTAALQRSVFTGEQSVFGLLESAWDTTFDRENLLAQTSASSLWNLSDLTYLTGPNGFNLTDPTGFQNEQWLLNLERIFKLLKSLGIAAEQAHAWSGPTLDYSQAQSIKQALKLAYDEHTWLTVMTSIQNDLRILRRDALLSYLLQTVSSTDSTDFYSYYLMDPEMDPCAKTSRMVEAHMAVQLFVQRILLNLEQPLTFSPEDAKGWEWRKNYRVWEAARKVFLWPENWLEPELRDNKSEFFKEVEDGLLQDDVTLETAERLYREYLYKLDQVSRLEIIGMYEDEDAVRGTKTLHVFGRTPDIPHHYYYRRWEDQARWAPWESVPLDIQADHLIPVVYNRRLYLFWPNFKVTENVPDTSWVDKLIEEVQEQQALLDQTIDETKGQISAWEEEFKDQEDPFPSPLQPFLENYLIPKWESAVVQKTNWESVRQDIIEQTPNHHIELGLAWSQYDGVRWAPKLVSKQDQKYEYDTDSDQAFHQFTGWVSSDNHLRIEVFTIPEPGVSGLDGVPKELQGYFSFNECGSEQVFLSQQDISPSYSSPKGHVFVTGANHLLNHWDIYTTTLQVNLIGNVDRRLLLRELHIQHCTVHYAHQHGLGGSETSPFFFADFERTYFVQPLKTYVYDDRPWLEQSGLSFRRELTISSKDLVSGKSNPTVPIHYQDLNTDQILDRTADGKSLGTITALNKSIQNILAKDEFVDARPWGAEIIPSETHYRFERFYHPYACLFIEQLSRYGIEGLLNPSPDWDDDSENLYRQLTPLETFDFEDTYQPTTWVHSSYPNQEIDFDPDSPDGVYNWELFFHIPLLIAARLMQNQRFAEARRWFHYIFDPTCTVGNPPARFWKIKPFYEEQLKGATETLQELIDLLKLGSKKLEEQVEAWEGDPFQPHILARLRIVAYMQTTVMKYLDCLISEADMLFTRDTREDMNQAAQLYLLAGELLGDKPALLPAQEAVTYTPNILLGRLSSPPIEIPRNPLDTLTSLFPTTLPGRPRLRSSLRRVNGTAISFEGAMDSYETLWQFCLPYNEKLYSYWDTIADRLFKIRHCMNIEGQVRQLPLFQPPIDPALLVRASAAGLDIASIISNLFAPLPHYRFTFVLQKALEFCGEVRNLGGALLSAVEKMDSEELSLLRNAHELSLLESIRELKKKSVEEADSTLQGLLKSKESAEFRVAYYSSLERISSGEQKSLDKQEESRHRQRDAETAETTASGLHLIPTLSGIVASFGGSHLGSAVQAFASYFRAKSAFHAYEANKAVTVAGYSRRQNDWKFQADLAKKEIQQLDKQIIAAEIRLQMAEKDLANHEIQIAQSEEVEEFLKLKFTNQQLYSWMVSHVSSLYFQSYQLAYDLARRAQKAYENELGVDDAGFISFGYWDSLKKGLLAGEKLNHDLRRMEAAYLGNNSREYELTRHVSLALLDPVALLNLTTEGECAFSIPEALFDLDFPGHYLRRIKSVSMTIPCVTGPYTSVSCKLTLTTDKTRKETGTAGGYAYTGPEDTRFVHNYMGQSISTSSGQNDGGVFELNFHDERYLPFERRGAVSDWILKLTSAVPTFDWSTITDVILHLSYTAREGGEPLRDAAIGSSSDADGGLGGRLPLQRGFSAKHEYSTAWSAFLRPAQGAEEAVLKLDLSDKRFPFFARHLGVTISELQLVALVKEPAGWTDLDGVKILREGQTEAQVTLASSQDLYAGHPGASVSFAQGGGAAPGEWTVTVPITATLGAPSEWIEDLVVVATYKLTFPD